MKECLFLVFIGIVFSFRLLAQDTLNEKWSFAKNTEISGQWFVSGSYNTNDSLFKFALKRGYVSIKNNISKSLSANFTQDITIDKEGSDAGNVEVRIKYLFLKQKLNIFPKFHSGSISAGMMPRPWIDFEGKFNHYRVMGEMFLESADVVSSSDIGVLYEANIGGEVDEKYKAEVNSSSSGKIGNIAMGLYNGGGYHAPERNNNKTFEARFSIRPLPNICKGLQIGYSCAFGQANVKSKNAKFIMNVAYLLSESKYHTAIAQYYNGVGDYSGTYIDSSFLSNKNYGYSFLGEVKIPKSKFSIVGRYDYFISANSFYINRINAGIAYKFYKNKIIVSSEYLDVKHKIGRILDLALEIKF